MDVDQQSELTNDYQWLSYSHVEANSTNECLLDLSDI